MVGFFMDWGSAGRGSRLTRRNKLRMISHFPSKTQVKKYRTQNSTRKDQAAVSNANILSSQREKKVSFSHDVEIALLIWPFKGEPETF
jgi:hypothetical protein